MWTVTLMVEMNKLVQLGMTLSSKIYGILCPVYLTKRDIKTDFYRYYVFCQPDVV